MKKLLIPLDGSKHSESVLPWASTLSAKLNQDIMLLRCYEPPASIYMMPETMIPEPSFDVEPERKQLIEDYLRQVKSRLPGGKAEHLSCEGDAALAILKTCEKDDIAAVVMASHGRGGLERWLLGSVATKVLRGSRTPIYLLNSHLEVKAPREVKNILVCLDGSALSEAAIPHAMRLATAFDAKITLYQGIEFSHIGNPHLEKAMEYQRVNILEYLDSVKAKFKGVQIETHTRIAGQDLGILEQAKRCDMLVMSSHGHSGLKRWMVGSTTEKIMQTVPKPLLIVYEAH